MRTAGIVGIDVGSSWIKIAAFDLAGQMLAVASIATPMQEPRPGLAELDAHDLVRTLHDGLREISLRLPEIEPIAIGVASYGESGFLMGANGTVLYPAIAWYDRRTEPYREQMRALASDEEWFASSGMTPDHIYSVLKLLWIRDHAPEVFARATRWYCLEDFVIWHLTGEAAIDYSLAGRTGVFDRRAKTWNESLLVRAALSPDLFAPAVPGGHPVGRLRRAVAEDVGFPESAIVCTGGHDHVCAAYALGAVFPGTLVDSTGTAEAIELTLSVPPPDAVVMAAHYDCYAHALNGRYVLSGHNPAVGAALEWTRKLTGLGFGAFYAQADHAAGSAPPGAHGLTCLPFFGGSGSPEGNREARAVVHGLSLQTSPADLIRGFYEGTAYWLLDNLRAMTGVVGHAPNRIVAGGGGSRSTVWLQIKADVLGEPIHVPDVAEAGALGAALLAGYGAGQYATPESALEETPHHEWIVEPDQERHAFYVTVHQDRYRHWKQIALSSGRDYGTPTA